MPQHGLKAHWGRAAVLWLVMFGAAAVSVPVRVSLRDGLALALLYALFALVLHYGSEAAYDAHRLLGWGSSVVIGAVLAWYIREQFRVPTGATALIATIFAVAAVHAFTRSGRPRATAARSMSPVLIALASTLALCVITVFLFLGSNTFRWHLLRHNKLLGTVAYYVLSEPVGGFEQRDRDNRTLEPAPPDAPLAVDLPEFRSVRQPDIVFVLVDTLRADGLEAYGGAASLMPRLNQIARESIVFADVIANASWTRPSLASFFTGLLPEEHAALDRGDRLPESATTLAEILNAAGYETAAFVANSATVGREAGFAQGFDHFEEFDDEAVYARAGQVNDAVRRWLSARGEGSDSTRPLFLYVHYLDPHTPYRSGGRNSVLHGVARRAYDAELRYLDGEIGRLFALLERSSSDPPMVLVTSDHGEEFGEHGERGHGKSLYWHNLQLPVLLHGPGLARGRVEASLEARDFFDLLVRMGHEGRLDPMAWADERARTSRYASLIFTRRSGLHRPYLRSVYMRRLDAGDRTLIWSAYGPTLELYDSRRDPKQRRNLFRDEPSTVERLRRRLDAHVSHWTTRVPMEVSPATRDRLRALGYLR